MYIVTSKTRSKMKRDKNSQSQLSAERQHYYQEQGVREIKPLKGQSEEETFEQVKSAGGLVKETMAKKREENQKAILEKQKARRGKTLKNAADRYFEMQKIKQKDS